MLLGAATFMRDRRNYYRKLLRDELQARDSNTPTLTNPQKFRQWADRAYERDEAVAPVLRSIQRRLESGHSLAQALQRFVPADESLILAAGESSGKLVEALSDAISAVETSKSMRSATVAALYQPVMALVWALLIAIGFGFWFWPSMLEVLPPKYWDDWALWLMKTHIKIAEYWPAAALFGLACVVYVVSLPRWVGRARLIADRFPPYNVYRNRMAASMISVLSSLSSSNATLSEAFKEIGRSENRYLAWQADLLRRNTLKYSGDIVRGLDTGFFARAILDEVADASRRRDFDGTLRYLGKEAFGEVVEIVKTSANIMNVVLMVFVAFNFTYVASVMFIGQSRANDRWISTEQSGQPQAQPDSSN